MFADVTEVNSWCHALDFLKRLESTIVAKRNQEAG